ncbi:MAG: hypothetical protein IKS52_09060 [Clostridia bacterium]|nr:hypothetical protein [Clostridia bacterium]MBO4884130.1 hypothetical protein [Clostridia bacterium]MBR4443402.1 hypothetical protein [Clostridia bacterium]
MSQIKIGWASRDVSTDKPINIPGQFHMRISKGVMDPVTVNALVLDDGEDQVIFLSCDLVVVRSHVLDIIREKLQARRPEIPGMKIIMNATHTHDGPSHYEDKPENRPFDYGMEVASSDEYRGFLTDNCVDAIIEAWDKRAPGAYAYGYGFAVVAHSRRVCYFDDVSKRPGAVINSTHGVNGTSVMYGNTNDDNFSHYEAGADHFVNLLYTFDAEGKLTGAIVNVPCPSQNSEHEWMLSADYWHNTREAIRAKHGNIFIAAQCAAAGDLSPRILHYKKAQDRRFRLKYGVEPSAHDTELSARKDIAERIAAAFDEVLSWAKKDIRTEAKIKHVVETVYLSRRMVTDEEYEIDKAGYAAESAKPFYTEKDIPDPQERIVKNSTLVSLRSRHKQILDKYEAQKTEPKVPMELHVVGIDDIAFATNRFELYMDFQHRIQARSPFEQTFIVQLTAQPGATGGTYLCTERGFKGRGYSASRYCNLVSPQGGQELVEETVKILKEIR